MGIPILNLPTVALQELLKNNSPLELLLLSQCSKRASRIVHIAGTKNFFLSIEYNDSAVKRSRKYSLGDSDVASVDAELKLKNGDMVPVKYSAQFCKVECQWIFEMVNCNLHDGLLRLAWHISEVFKCPIKKLTSKYNESSAESLANIKKVVGRQNDKIEKLFIFNNFEGKHLKWILNNVKVTGKLFIYMQREYKFKASTWSDCDELDLLSTRYQRWITLAHFEAFKSCRKVHIELDYKEIDEVVTKWTTGILPKLEELSIGSHKATNHKIMGFSKEELKRNEEYVIVDGKIERIDEPGVAIEAENGTKARISWNEANGSYTFYLKVSKE